MHNYWGTIMFLFQHHQLIDQCAMDQMDVERGEWNSAPGRRYYHTATKSAYQFDVCGLHRTTKTRSCDLVNTDSCNSTEECSKTLEWSGVPWNLQIF